MKKTAKSKKTSNKSAKTTEHTDKAEKKVVQVGSKFGVLGKDLSSKFSSRRDSFFRPTKPGGRNGQGKPT